MELKDFTEKEQEQIEKGLSTAEISDKEATNRVLFEEAIAATIDAFHPNIRLSRCPHSRCPMLILGLEGIQRVELSQILGTIAKNYKDGGSDSKSDNGNDGPSGAVGNTNDNKGAE